MKVGDKVRFCGDVTITDMVGIGITNETAIDVMNREHVVECFRDKAWIRTAGGWNIPVAMLEVVKEA